MILLSLFLICFVSSATELTMFHVNSVEDNSSFIDDSYAMDMQNDFLYIGGNVQGFQIVDVSDSANPVVTGYLNTLNGIIDLKVQGNYVYAVSLTSPSDLNIIDISDSANPVITNTVTLNGQASGIDVDSLESYAYVVYSDNSNLEIVNLSDNSIITPSYDLTTTANDILVDGNYAYVVSSASELKILDITDLSSITQVSILTDDGTTALNGAWSIFKEGNYLYILSSEGFEIINVSDPLTPTLMKAVYKTDAILNNHDVNGIFVKNNMVYLSLTSPTQGIVEEISLLGILTVVPPSQIFLIIDSSTSNNILLDTPREIIVNGNYAFVTSSDLILTKTGLEVIGIDDYTPVIEIIAPTNATTIYHNVTAGALSFEFKAKITDDFSGIKNVIFSLKTPNGVITNYPLTSLGNDEYSAIVSLTAYGTYEASFEANDFATRGKTEYTTFTISEPVVSSGGGGGGGGSCSYNINYDWKCSSWGECVDGTQTRTCNNLNNCGSTYGRPDTEQTCIIEIIPETVNNATETNTAEGGRGLTGAVIGGTSRVFSSPWLYIPLLVFAILIAGWLLLGLFRKKDKKKK